MGRKVPEAPVVSIHESENMTLKAALADARARDIELSARFLEVVTKLGSVCTAFQINAGLEKAEFAKAVNTRRDEIRKGARP